MFGLFRNQKKVTLVLGGGSARGIAHIGVLKILEKNNIPVSNIVGTSMGALVGAAHAVGIPTSTMHKLASEFTSNKLLDPTLPTMGLLAGDKLEAAIRDLLDSKGFEDCKIPMAVVTTDIETGEEVVYQKGDLLKIVRASCSWPGIFNPVRIDGRLLCDGGVKNSVPVMIAKSLGAEYILAVDVGFCVKVQKVENIFQMILQAFQITGEELNKYQSGKADFVIKVDLGDIDQASFGRSREAMEKGFILIEKKLYCACIDISDGLCAFYGCISHLLTQFTIKSWRRGLFDELLMAPLDRAIPFPEMYDMSVGITQYLYLNMPRSLYVLFYIDIRIAECRFRLSFGCQQGADQPNVIVTDAHALAAAACRRLDDNRIFHLLGDLKRIFFCLDYSLAARYYRHAGLSCRILSRHLVAHPSNIFRSRAYEFDLAGFAYLCEVSILRQKSITRVYRLDVCDLCCADYTRDIEITICACG